MTYKIGQIAHELATLSPREFLQKNYEHSVVREILTSTHDMDLVGHLIESLGSELFDNPYYCAYFALSIVSNRNLSDSVEDKLLQALSLADVKLSSDLVKAIQSNGSINQQKFLRIIQSDL